MKARAPLAFVAGAIIATTLLAIGGARSPAAAEPGPSREGRRSVEEVRVRRDGDLVRTLRVTFAADFAGDTDAIADAMAAERGFAAEDAHLTSSYVAQRSWRPDLIPVAVRYNPGAAPLSMEGSITRAIATWNAVANQSFRYQYAGATNAGASVCAASGDGDGINVLQFGSLPGGTLGLTCTGFIDGRLFEFDMVVNNAIPWSAASPTPSDAYDLDTTVLHELGHALGLGHSQDAVAVMFDSAFNGESRRVLAADDIAGLRALYGVAAPPTASPPPPTTSGLTVAANGPYIAGANAVAVLGAGSAAEVASAVAAQSGRPVQALWLLSSGRWLFFLPSAPGIEGGLRQFQGGLGRLPGPVASMVAVLG